METKIDEKMDRKRELLIRLLENLQKEDGSTAKDIAIIGISGRYPGAETPGEYWENLKAGRNCISEIPGDRWDWREYTDKSYSRWGGFIKDVDKFDPLFFHIPPREAEVMDPQERLFLETAWKVFEDAGYTNKRFEFLDHRVGVFVGVMNNHYEWLSGYTYAMGHNIGARGAYWSIANRVSYFFNFRGPSMAVDTACSSSLTAIHLACDSLKRGECELALAGGVNLILSPSQYQRLCSINMITADNRCKTFGAGADGFVDGEGVGAVLLKPLDRAAVDGDIIYAVIKGSAINAGGKTSGYTVPNPNAQAVVISSALDKANINPRTIGYVEAHGTGTSLGDPIEIAGLTHAFRKYTRDKQYCSIGSSKSNIGHLESAAGIAAMTKVLLQLKHRQLVPTLHCEPLNPKIDFEDSPFYIQKELVLWKKMVIVENGKDVEYPRRAGISSFGAGGANAHVVLEEYEELNKKFCGGPGAPRRGDPKRAKYFAPYAGRHAPCSVLSHPGRRRQKELILLSAKNEDRLRAYAGKMVDFLEKTGDSLSLADISYTLQMGREPMEERLAVEVFSVPALKDKLQQFLQGQTSIMGLYQGHIAADETGDKNQVKAGPGESQDRLAQLWVSGENVDWSSLYEDQRTGPHLISLPTYPFARKRYWRCPVPGPARGTDSEKNKQKQEVQDPLQDFFYIPGWRLLPPPTKAPAAQTPGRKKWVLFVYAPGSSNIKKVLAARHGGDRVFEIRLGSQTRQHSPGVWEINIPDDQAVERAINRFRLRHLEVVYFLGGIQPEVVEMHDLAVLEESQQRGVFSLFRLGKTLDQAGLLQSPLQVNIITNHARQVWPADLINPFAASLHGLGKTMGKEYPRLKVRCIDMDGDSLEAVAHMVGDNHGDIPGEIALRGGRCYIPIIESLALPSLPSSSLFHTSFKHRGVYFILGGAGGIGLELGLHLARTVQARLALVGRSDRNQLKPHQEEKIAQIESCGGEVLYIQADAANFNNMKSAVKTVESHLGTINGVIHSAIVLRDGTLQNMDEESLRAALDPKVKSSVILYKAFKEKTLDFMMFFSSAQSFTCNTGQGNYAAGCTFKDAFALWLSQVVPYPVKIINWGYWGSVGIVASEAYKRRLAGQGIISIEPEEGMEAVQRIMAHRVTQVLPLKAEDRFLEKLGIQCDHRLEIYPGDGVGQWDFDPVLSQVQPPSPDPGPGHRLEEAYVQLNRWAREFLFSIFQQMGIFQHTGERYQVEALQQSLGIIPSYTRLFNELLNMLVRAGFLRPGIDGGSSLEVVTTGAAAKDGPGPRAKHLEKQKERLLKAFPDITAHIRLVWTCLNHYPRLLRGEIPATDVMFPGSGMELVEGIYKGNQISDDANGLVVQIVCAYVQSRLLLLGPGEKIKILEIGAGTGGTTTPVLESLHPHAEQLHYIYTDISSRFTKYGKEHFGTRYPMVEFRILNIEEDICQQGCENGDMDVVIAANVLHATRNIAKTLRNTKALLKTHGWLILNEGANVQDFATLTFGLLGGWWLFEDEENRLPGCPLLGQGMWERLLKDEGFDRVVFPGKEMGKSNTLPHHLIVIARSNGLVRKKRAGTLRKDSVSKLKSQGIPRQQVIKVPNTGAQDKGEFIEKTIGQCLTAVLQIETCDLDPKKPYSDFGVDSILAIEIVKEINRALGINLRSTDLFNYSSIEKLTHHIVDQFIDSISLPVSTPVEMDEPLRREEIPLAEEERAPGGAHSEAIAVIGMSARFADADNIHEFWNNLVAGRDSVKEITRWNVENFYDPDPQVTDKSYCKWGGFLTDIDQFDPLFFNISPKEAELMDPQQRIFLEQAWKALEDAGYSDQYLGKKKCGVFVGFNGADYEKLIEENGLLPNAYAMTGNFEAMLSARISYFLNLWGPALTINTACSSSLVAVHLAYESIRSRTSDMAIAGGVMVMIKPRFYLNAGTTDMLSASGRCKTFDNRADGFVPAEGAAAVVLKPLERAREDGDHIYGVIVASGINYDGSSNGITAPNGPSQTALECEVYDRYNIDPGTITYVETHGTATRLGDPIEVDALTDAFRKYTSQKQYCAIGSVKTNIGHTLAAAGAAGLIKVLLCLKYKKLVPSINFEKENEFINFKDSPFYVNTQLKEWQPGEGIPRTAAVSSFGFSGTNAHVVLSEPPKGTTGLAPLSVEPPATTPPYYLISISAKTSTAQNQKLTDMIHWLEHKGNQHQLKDISYTLLAGRSHFSLRSCLLVENNDDTSNLKANLQQVLKGKEIGNYLFHHMKKSQFKPEPAMVQLGERLIKELKEQKEQRLTTNQYKDKLLALADLYVKGYDLDWWELYRGEHCQRISLPFYPFFRQRCWVPENQNGITGKTVKPTVSVISISRLHPLLDANESTLEEQCFKKILTREDFYMRDHVVQGKMVFPAAAYLEMARAAGNLAYRKAKVVKIKNIVWTTPITMEKKEHSREVYITLYPTSHEGTVGFTVNSANHRERRMTHARGQLVYDHPQGTRTPLKQNRDQRLDIESIKRRCSSQSDGSVCSQLTRESGLQYGPSFCLIRQLYQNRNGSEALSQLELPHQLHQEFHEFELHPSIIDAALQTVMGLEQRRTAPVQAPYVPFAVEEVEIINPLTGKGHAYAVLAGNGHPGTREKIFDIQLVDQKGWVLVKIRNFSIRKPGSMTIPQKSVSINPNREEPENKDSAAKDVKRKETREILEILRQLKSGKLEIPEADQKLDEVLSRS
jgi:acyl transferase domain-containing protein/NAD(P)-dependent dehydrogenase (short-subunit alcohol dehydrogenase family)/SAM-dependent methyltransferase/acyl carrier protein